MLARVWALGIMNAISASSSRPRNTHPYIIKNLITTNGIDVRGDYISAPPPKRVGKLLYGWRRQSILVAASNVFLIRVLRISSPQIRLKGFGADSSILTSDAAVVIANSIRH
jgi:hypothetical protein